MEVIVVDAKVLRNQTMEARRRAAPLLGSRGRRGLRVRGDWRGLAEMVELKESFEGVGATVVERERWKREEAWVRILAEEEEVKRAVVFGVWGITITEAG